MEESLVALLQISRIRTTQILCAYGAFLTSLELIEGFDPPLINELLNSSPFSRASPSQLLTAPLILSRAASHLEGEYGLNKGPSVGYEITIKLARTGEKNFQAQS